MATPVDTTPALRSWTLIDGELIDPGALTIASNDRGVTSGDGVYTTMRVVDGVPFALSRHRRRLAASLDYLGLVAADVPWERLAERHAPDVLLLDLNIPGGGGIEAARAVVAAVPATRVIMLTASVDEDDLAAAMAAGARGYILKGVAARELVSIIRRVHGGEGYVAPSLAASLLAGLGGPRPSAPGKT